MDGREKETIFARQNIFSLMRCKSQVDNFGIGRTLWLCCYYLCVYALTVSRVVDA